MPLDIGQQAPDFELPSTERATFKLSRDMSGKSCIVYFYPKDFTDVCTAEACEFRDSFDDFRELDIPVIGISRDDIATHKKFKTANQLPFELLTDNAKVAEKYKSVVPIIGFIRRVTYLLNAHHKVVAVYENLFNAKSHIKAMLEQLKEVKK